MRTIQLTKQDLINVLADYYHTDKKNVTVTDNSITVQIETIEDIPNET